VTRTRNVYLILILLAAAAVISFWWISTRSDQIAFLPEGSGAEWIVYPRPLKTGMQDAVTRTTLFRYRFVLSAVPQNASLKVRAFKSGEVSINGQLVNAIKLAGQRWKFPTSAEAAALLRPGTNELIASVTNNSAPPALWLRLDAGHASTGTDESWQASLSGDDWKSAKLARHTQIVRPGSSLVGETTLASLKRAWPLVAGFFAVSLALVLASRWLPRSTPSRSDAPRSDAIWLLLALVLLARIALSINNLPQLPRMMGFDAGDHEEYIQFLEQKHTIPYATDGWEMYQPPLFYASAALFLHACGHSMADETATLLVRTFNTAICLLHCWLILLCLRLLFPGNLRAQAAGLLVAAFLPPHLYLSFYVTNELLAGLWVTLAIYACLRILRAERPSPWAGAGLGAALGAAMLTKSSALLAVPILPIVLGLRLLARKNRNPRDWVWGLGPVLISWLLVCGWYYARVWVRFGRPIIGNWDAESGQAWWQDPGYRTWAFFAGFGRALVTPLSASLHSFGDGLYATLWGDGLASGAALRVSQPPWNYHLMGVGYLLALGLSVLFVVGLGVAFARWLKGGNLEWFLMAGTVALFGAGILYMSLRVPSYAQVKAFYAFPALLPFCALIALGYERLGQRQAFASLLEKSVLVLLLVWGTTTFGSFWVRKSNPATLLVRGIDLASRQHRYPGAVECLAHAVQLNPEASDFHRELALALRLNGEPDKAEAEYLTALRLDPDDAIAHKDMGVILAASGRLDAGIGHMKESVRLDPEEAESYANLGTALLNSGATDDAIKRLQEAIRIKPSYALAHKNLGVAFARKGLLDEAIVQFREALRAKPDFAEAEGYLRKALAQREAARP
jgi:tetratricopeptide (TPR) repeat protein